LNLKYEALEDVRKDIISCRLCDLCKSRKNAVPGEGGIHAKIMFIGEAPGRLEDEKGRPFVGTAGRILDEVLDKVGIRRSEVFITNIVKCRPPANRIPTDEERNMCRQFLDTEIKLVSPKIICILGRTALNSIIGGAGKSIMQSRGKFINHNFAKYFLTIHPAAIIYNPKLRIVLEKDLAILSEECQKIGLI
jgi:uracil-DNA glycosylase